MESWLYFLYPPSRGSVQIWSMNPGGSGVSQVTRLSTEAEGELVSPDGKYLLVTSNVFPECGADDGCNQKRLDAEKDNKVKARLITGLLYRHWTTWEGKAAQPPAFHLTARRWQGCRPFTLCCASFLRSPSVAPTTMPSLPMAGKSASAMNTDEIPCGQPTTRPLRSFHSRRPDPQDYR